MLRHLLTRATRNLRHTAPFAARSKAPINISVRMASTFPKLPIFEAIASHDPTSIAIVHSKSNRTFSYDQLLSDVEGAKIQLYHKLKEALRDGESIGGQRVAFLIENGYDYVGARCAMLQMSAWN